MGRTVSATVTPIRAALPEWFKAAFRDFLASWNQTLTKPEIARAYWDTLSECDQGDVEAAGLELRRTAGGEFPPSAGRWYETAQRIGRERRLQDILHLGRERHWRAECEDCEDTGWIVHTCTAANRCGRAPCLDAAEAHTHTYACACPCRATNRTYQRNRERERTSKRTDPSETRRSSGGGGWTKASEAR